MLGESANTIMTYWTAASCFIVLAISGLNMTFGKPLPLPLIGHFSFIGAMIGHIYIGTVGMEGAFEAMGNRTVDLNWAGEHHSLWLERKRARTI